MRTLRYRDLSSSTLRAALATLTALNALPKQREAIQIELATRGWCEAIEARLHEAGFAWTERGGCS